MNSKLLPVVITVLLLVGVGECQRVTLTGEAGLDSGIVIDTAGAERLTSVPVVVRARVQLDADLGGGTVFHGVILPAFGSGTGAEPLASPGLQEAYFRLRYGGTDLSVGFERLPLSQMRLIEPVGVESRLETGEPRGPMTLRVLHYSGPWRARGSLLAVTGDDLLPDGPGGVVSLRHESPTVTIEGHVLWTLRQAFGVTVSGSPGALVAYGEAWLLATPWEGRGGVGLSGYLEEWLMTIEAGWTAPSGDLLLPSGPVVAASASRAIGSSSALDASAVLSWPRSPLDGPRATQVDAAISLRQDQENASFTVTPAVHISGELVAASLGVSVRSYY